MKTRFRLLLPLAILVLQFAGGCSSSKGVPAGYPSDYGDLIEAGESEGAVTVYGTIGDGRIDKIAAAFEKKYPKIRVTYIDMTADQAFRKTIAEGRARRGIGDIVWTSAMDLQIKLVNDGYAQRYVSPEREALPPGLVWKNEAFGITAERVVFAYNRGLLGEDDVPQTHSDFARFLDARPDLAGRVATYDPEKSAVGFMFLREDVQASADTWQLVAALGKARARLVTSSDEVLKAMSSGEVVIAYNVIGSYAQKRQRHDEIIGYVVPQDYTLLMSRIALISREAPHPSAARLFLDFLLSREGQSMLAQQSVQPVREDVELPEFLRAKTGQRRTIRVGPALLTHLDRLTRDQFLRQWDETFVPADTVREGKSGARPGK